METVMLLVLCSAATGASGVLFAWFFPRRRAWGLLKPRIYIADRYVEDDELITTQCNYKTVYADEQIIVAYPHVMVTWIPVDVARPVSETPVLMATRDSISYGSFTDKQKGLPVTHWQPKLLPEGPA